MEFLKKAGNAILTALKFLGSNIFNVVTIIIALIIYPVAYSINLILIQVSTNDSLSWLFELVNQGESETSLGGMGLEISLSIKRIIDIINGKDEYSFIMDYIKSNEDFVFPEALQPVKIKLIIAAVCFVLALLIALFIIIWSCISKKRFPVLIASAGGALTTVIMMAVFGSASNFITSDAFNISSLIADAGWLADILLGVIQIDTFALAGVEIGFLAVFIGILVWTGAFYLVEIGEEKEPAKKHK